MKTRIMILGIIASFLPGCNNAPESTLEASGTIEGIDMRISSEVRGRVVDLRVDEGSTVERNDTLLQIDRTEYEIQLRQAAAAARAGEAQYQLAVEGARKEDLVQAEAAFDVAKKDYERAESLLRTETITRKQYDDAQMRFVSARETYEKLVSGLRDNEIAAARASRDQANALVDQSRKRVSDCTIMSPSRGVVTVKSVERGELVPVGGGLFRVTALDTVKLTIYVSQLSLPGIHVGQDAAVSIDGAPERTFPGTIVFISDVAEFTPKNVQTKEERTKLVFAVRIRIPNPDHILKPGMPADARIQMKEIPS